MGAVLVSVLNPLLTSIGAGWTFVLIGGLGGLLVTILSWVVIRDGEKWRRRRSSRSIRNSPEVKP